MSTTDITASSQITDEVTSWPGIEAGYGSRGEYAFKLRHREVGHLHGDHSAHFFFPKDVWRELSAEGRITEHPVFPGRVGPAARQIRGAEDIRDVIALMRLNYDRIVTR
jgi:hypothetical protein